MSLSSIAIANDQKGHRYRGANPILLNISGNKYRLIVKVEYRLRAIYIRFIGTHADYNKIAASTL